MLMRNEAEIRQIYDPLDIYCEPGECVEVPDAYCQPTVAANGSRAPSLIEDVCPGLVPAGPEDFENWKLAPTPKRSPGRPRKIVPTVEQLIKKGVAPGAAEILAAKAAAENGVVEDA